MKKSKILVLALTSVMATSVFGLAGCTGGGGNGGGGSSIEHTQHTYGNWEYNSTQHWKKCTHTGCDAEEGRASHQYGNGYTCEVCGYVNESLKPGEIQSMSTYFSGMKTTSTRINIVDADKNTRTFDDLLDRQLDVLSQDIIYRLAYVYSDYRNDDSNIRNISTQELNKLILNNNLSGSVFSYNGNNAVVNNGNLISNTNMEYSKTDILSQVSLKNVDDIQKSLIIVQNNKNNILSYDNALNFIGAISGNRMKKQSDGWGDVSFTQDTNKAWIMNLDLSNNSTISDYRKSLKVYLAQLLTNMNLNNYNELLNNVQSLGFDNNFKTLLSKLIYEKVIGENLVSKDLEYQDYISKNFNGIINSDTIISIKNNKSFTLEDSPIFYKAYNIIIPAIVEQALSNTFEGTTQTIYPSMSRYATDYSSNVFTTSTSNFDSIVLAPRTSTPATKLVVKIEGTGNNVELTIGCSVNGSNASSNQKKVRLSASGETVEFDLHSYSTIGSYNGSTEKDTNNDLFANNQTSKNSSDGSNYIKLVFTNPSNAMFRVTFTGYYNK